MLPKVTIAWPERSRDFAAPASASSAAIILESSGGSDYAWQVDRPTDPSASTQTYTATVPVRQGTYLVRVNFHAATNGEGSLVAYATASATLGSDGVLRRADGTPFGTITFNSTISQVVVMTNQEITVGQSGTVFVWAVDNQGNPISVSPGAIKLEVIEGAEFLRLNEDGMVTGLAAGVATVVATIDGVRSEPVQVRVTAPALATRALDLKVNDMVFDPTRNRIWASVPSSEANGNSIAEIDPMTATVVSSTFVGSEPSALALSDDYSTLYVGLNGAGAVRKVDLVSKTAGMQFELEAPFGDAIYATDIAVQPGSTTTVGVTTGSLNSTGTFGPAIYDNGAKRPKSLFIYEGTDLVWTSPSRIVSYNGSHTGSELIEVLVDEEGATKGKVVSEGLSAFAYGMIRVGNRLYGSEGSVVNAGTLQRIGRFQWQTQGAPQVYGVAVDPGLDLAYFVVFDQNQNLILAFDTETFVLADQARLENVPVGGFSYAETHVILWGRDHLAFNRGDRVYFVDNAPEN